MDKPDLHIIETEVLSRTSETPAFTPPPAAVVNGVVQPVVAAEPPKIELPGMSANELRSQAAIARSEFGMDYLAAKSMETLAKEAEERERLLQRAVYAKFRVIQPEIQWYASEIERKHNDDPGLLNPVTVGLAGAGVALAQYVFRPQATRSWGDAAFQAATGFVAGAIAGLVLVWIAQRLHVVKLPLAMPVEVQTRFFERQEAAGKQMSEQTWQLLQDKWTESATEWNGARKSLADYVVATTQALQPVAQALQSARR